MTYKLIFGYPFRSFIEVEFTPLSSDYYLNTYAMHVTTLDLDQCRYSNHGTYQSKPGCRVDFISYYYSKQITYVCVANTQGVLRSINGIEKPDTTNMWCMRCPFLLFSLFFSFLGFIDLFIAICSISSMIC